MLETLYRFIIILLLISSSLIASDENAVVLAKHGVKEIIFAERTYTNDGHWYANFGYDWSGRALYGEKGRLCKLDLATGEVNALIDDPTGSVRDPQVHYDAKKILFSYRKGGTDHYHLYEIDIDGNNLKQLTSGIYDELEPTYLPDGGIMCVSSRSRRWVNCWFSQVANLYRCNGDGTNMRVISANIEQDNTPWVMNDGRILFTRWEYVDRSQVKFHHLWTCNPDGSNQKVFFGNMHPGNVFIDAKPIPDSDLIVMIDSPGHGQKEHAGFLATVTAKNGPDDKAAIKHITEGKEFRDPYAITKDLFLATENETAIVLVDETGKASPLYGGEFTVNEPRPVMERQREPLIPSRIDMAKATGTLILNNVYVGRNMKGVKRGDIKKLLILETLPKPLNYGDRLWDFIPLTLGGTFTLERIIGTVPVEEDGSAHFELPANRPFFFIAVNEKNETVKRMHSFLSVMPGEVTGCVGCHEKKTDAPQIEQASLMALARPASKVTPVPDVPYTIDFPTHIQPILDRHCVKCHNPDKPDGRITLSGDHGPCFSLSYINLFAMGYISHGENKLGNRDPRSVGDVASKLMKMLDGSHYKAKLNGKEVEMIRNWIHIGAPYPGTYAALGTGMIRNNRDLPKEYWRTHKKAQAMFKKNCIGCHDNKMPEMHDYPIAGKVDRKKQSWSPHAGYNLTHPEKSGLLMAPLSKQAGGWGICKAKDSKDSPGVIKDKNDPTFQAILAHIEEGKKVLETIKRWDMPGFKPNPLYIREMKRFGVMSEEYDREKDTVDVFTIDRRYFEMHWHYPDSSVAPKLFENKKFHAGFRPTPRNGNSGNSAKKKNTKPIPVVNGLYEAECANHLTLTKKPADRTLAQNMTGWSNAWSNDEQILWLCKMAEREMTFSFEVKEPGTALRLALTKAPDYGIFEFYLDGKKISDPIDLYDPKVLLAADIDIENLTIGKGTHQLKIRCVGKNEKSKGFFFGIDYVQVISFSN
ncbi:MAG: hypothetical protein PF904_11930 [Kiritimatiellae bacterium]|jgi:hypothetical protein|nr:hypothetical protein [Kiritimatiellia bacterium]